MQISAINSVNNFGHSDSDVIDVTPIDVSSYYPPVASERKFDIDRVDFSAIADAVNQDKPENKAESPTKFFLTSALLTLASFVAAKKVSHVAIKTIENKLSLSKPMANLGKTINIGIEKMKAKTPADITSIKTFFTSNTNKALKWAGNAIENAGKKGVTPEDIAAFKKLMGNKVPEGALYAKNALTKTMASVLGLGSAGATVSSRYSDENGNGIPDKAEKAFGKLDAAKEILKNVAAVCDVAA